MVKIGRQKVNKKTLIEINELIKVQKDCITTGYMAGLCNGLIMAKSIITGEDPVYVDNPDQKKPEVKDKSELYIEGGEGKQCFCVGPENCEDETCSLVEAHKKKIGDGPMQ